MWSEEDIAAALEWQSEQDAKCPGCGHPMDETLDPNGPDYRAANRIFADGASAVFSSRSEEHTSELQSLMRISYAVFCLKKKKDKHTHHNKKATTYITIQ